MTRLSSSCLLGPLLIAAAVTVAPSQAWAAKDQPTYSIVRTEIATSEKKPGEQAALADALRAASDEEAHYYDPARTPAVLRIRIGKLAYKSAGKAVAGSIPFVGLLAGSNRNELKGEVEIVDPVSGQSLDTFRVDADNDTFFSAGDAALSMGKAALSLLPFGMLVSGAVDVAQGAATHRAASQAMLTRGFVMLSYRHVYGDQAYKGFAAQRKAAWAASKTGPSAPAPSTSASAAEEAPKSPLPVPSAG